MSLDRGTRIALTAGALLAAACRGDHRPANEAATTGSGAAEQQALVNCLGANACKAKSACHTDRNMCAGMNACKGQGWIDLPPAACASAGGKVIHATR